MKTWLIIQRLPLLTISKLEVGLADDQAIQANEQLERLPSD